VKVAILTGCDLLCLDIKRGLRRAPRPQELTVCLAVNDDLDPFDVVRLLHGVGNASDLHFEGASGLFHHRDVLLPGGIHRVLDEELHRLAAAYELSLAFVEHLHDVTANFALVDL
jgi:hypothetical protein